MVILTFNVDITSKDSKKFLNYLESCNILQHVHKPTHLQGHTLNLILSANDSSAVSQVWVGDFIFDHASVLDQLNFTNPSVSMSKTVTFRRFHRINMDCLRSDLSNCSFVKAPGNAASVLYEQYTNDLKELLDKHTPEVSRTFIKGPAKWRSVLYLLSKAVRRQFECIWRKDKNTRKSSWTAKADCSL